MLTKDEQEMLYGNDINEWLKRWDEGQSVWSIEMGGFGPGYEQAIQITMAEILRHLIAEKYDITNWGKTEIWEKDREKIKQMSFNNSVIKSLGLSGAQWGAAMSLALYFYRKNPIGVMNEETVKDRHIQVSRVFPSNS